MTINFRNDLGRTSIKKINNTYTIKQAVQWPTSVALNTHTLKGVVCCNRWQAKDGNGLKLEKVGPTFQV